MPQLKKKKKQIHSFHWTRQRKQIADLAAQGKKFEEIVTLGYGKDATSKTLAALKRGVQVPEHIADDEIIEAEDPGHGGGGTDRGRDSTKGQPLVAASSPKTAPIVFRFAQKEIILDPLELHTQYRYYEDLARRNGGFPETFSQVLTLGMKVLWVLHQDVPMDTDILKAVFSK